MLLGGSLTGLGGGELQVFGQLLFETPTVTIKITFDSRKEVWRQKNRFYVVRVKPGSKPCGGTAFDFCRTFSPQADNSRATTNLERV